MPGEHPVRDAAGHLRGGERQAKAAGLDIARLKRDMQAPDVSDQIIAVFNQARAIRVFQTPAFIIAGPRGAHILGSESATLDFAREVAAARH